MGVLSAPLQPRQDIRDVRVGETCDPQLHRVQVGPEFVCRSPLLGLTEEDRCPVALSQSDLGVVDGDVPSTPAFGLLRFTARCASRGLSGCGLRFRR